MVAHRSPGLALLAIPLCALLASPGCGGSPPPPPSAPGASAATDSAESKAGPSPEDDAAKKAAAIETMTAEEAKSGSCTAEHQAALEKLLDGVESGMKTKNGEDGKPLAMQLVGKKVLALGPSAKSFEMSVTGRGTEVHVMAYGAKDVSMDVLVGTAAATTLRSPHQRTAIPELALDVAGVGKVSDVQSDSRKVTIKPGQPLVVKVTGQGCAGIISFLEP